MPQGIANPSVTGGDILHYFPHTNNDGLYLSFYHGANSIAEMNEALKDGKYCYIQLYMDHGIDQG